MSPAVSSTKRPLQWALELIEQIPIRVLEALTPVTGVGEGFSEGQSIPWTQKSSSGRRLELEQLDGGHLRMGPASHSERL